jgi:hypothetical protein
MTNGKKDALVGKVVGSKAAASLSNVNALDALTSMVNSTTEYLRIKEEETTKRDRLQTYAELEMQKIRAAESILSDYFGQVFRERRQVVDDLLARYDAAVEQGDSRLAQTALQGIVDVAKDSPLKDLGDLGEIRKALDDQSHVWDL